MQNFSGGLHTKQIPEPQIRYGEHTKKHFGLHSRVAAINTAKLKKSPPFWGRPFYSNIYALG